MSPPSSDRSDICDSERVRDCPFWCVRRPWSVWLRCISGRFVAVGVGDASEVAWLPEFKEFSLNRLPIGRTGQLSSDFMRSWQEWSTHFAFVEISCLERKCQFRLN
jgi:hypothetical protein